MVLKKVKILLVLIITVILFFVGDYYNKRKYENETAEGPLDYQLEDVENMFSTQVGNSNSYLIIVLKNDEEEYIKNAKFRIYNESKTFDKELETNSYGKIGINGFENERYYIEQMSTIEGYQVDKNRYILEDEGGYIKTIKNLKEGEEDNQKKDILLEPKNEVEKVDKENENKVYKYKFLLSNLYETSLEIEIGKQEKIITEKDFFHYSIPCKLKIDGVNNLKYSVEEESTQSPFINIKDSDTNEIKNEFAQNETFVIESTVPTTESKLIFIIKFEYNGNTFTFKKELPFEILEQ